MHGKDSVYDDSSPVQAEVRYVMMPTPHASDVSMLMICLPLYIMTLALVLVVTYLLCYPSPSCADRKTLCIDYSSIARTVKISTLVNNHALP